MDFSGDGASGCHAPTSRQPPEGYDWERRGPRSSPTRDHSPGLRRDLTGLKIAVFEKISRRHQRRTSGNEGSGSAQQTGPPVARLWALYRKSLRLFLIGELTKPELDAVVIYSLGDENGTRTGAGRVRWRRAWVVILFCLVRVVAHKVIEI